MDLNSMKKQAAQAGKEIGSQASGALDALTGAVKKGVGPLQKEADLAKVGANTRDELFQKICALIPAKINNETVVNVLDLMRDQQKLLRKDFSTHLAKNKAAVQSHADKLKKADGYVEDQNSWTDVAYGDATMQFSGCEIFATFNAIRNLTGSDSADLTQLISSYEKDGMVLSGKFGTAPRAIRDQLKKMGYKTVMTTKEAEFDQVGKDSQTLILTMYNDKNDISKEVHTINISKDGEKYTAHNVYCNGQVVGPYKSVSEVIAHINKGLAKGISLIGISR